MYDTSGIGVFLGLDVGKGEHHAHGLTPAGKKVFDKRLPNTEPRLRAVFDKLTEKFGTVLVIVDQPADIGALPLTVARHCGCQVAYLPGLAMRRAAEMYEGEAKTDARDAFVIADVARTNPRTLRQITVADETQAELTMLVGFDDDLAGESTRTSNRLRGLLAQIHPSLERVLGPRIQHEAVLELLGRLGSPEQLRKAGTSQIAKVLKPKAPRMAERLAAEITEALAEQTVVVPGTKASAIIVPSLARQLAEILEQRRMLQGPARSPAGGPPSFPTPDLDARHRRQDRRHTAGHRRRRQHLPRRRPPRLLRRPVPGDQVLRILHQGRARAQTRQPTAQTRHVPIRVRRPAPSRLPRLLRPSSRGRKNPHPGAATPSQTPHHRPVRDAPRQRLLPTRHSNSLSTCPTTLDERHRGTPRCRAPAGGAGPSPWV